MKKLYSQKELNEFKKLILKRKEELLKSIRYISEENLKKSQKDATGDISGYTYHMADVATDTYERDFSLNLATTEQKELYELEEALRRIEEGNFGICEGCKSLIPKIRLRAVPYARFCIKCQEKKDKGFL